MHPIDAGPNVTCLVNGHDAASHALNMFAAAKQSDFLILSSGLPALNRGKRVFTH